MYGTIHLTERGRGYMSWPFLSKKVVTWCVKSQPGDIMDIISCLLVDKPMGVSYMRWLHGSCQAKRRITPGVLHYFMASTEAFVLRLCQRQAVGYPSWDLTWPDSAGQCLSARLCPCLRLGLTAFSWIQAKSEQNYIWLQAYWEGTSRITSWIKHDHLDLL